MYKKMRRKLEAVCLWSDVCVTALGNYAQAVILCNP